MEGFRKPKISRLTEKTVAYLTPDMRGQVDELALSYGGQGAVIRAALDVFFLNRIVRKTDVKSTTVEHEQVPA